MHRFFCAVAFLLVSTAAPAMAQPKTKPIPEPLPMGVPYWYMPVVPPAGTYYTVVAAARPVVVVTPYGPVATTVPTTPVVVGPTWALSPVAVPYTPYWTVPVSYPYPFASSGPVYGRYTWDYTGIPSGGYGWYSTNLPHYPYSYQYPTIAGRVWMGYGW
jgi:hypothetical protein